MFKILKLLLFLHILQYFKQMTMSADADYSGTAFSNNSQTRVKGQFQVAEGPASHCINYERTIKSARDKLVVLDKINSRRNKVASGDIRSLRPASNMAKLDWNEDLAICAQRWADQCVAHDALDSTDCCRCLNDSSVGQNVATVYDDAPGLTPMMLVDLWYIELLNVNSSASVMFKYQRSPGFGSEHYDYFTQLIWAETTQVGCGAVKFKEEIKDLKGNRNRTVYRLVCNFVPAGNQVGQAVYSVGPPCSRCPSSGVCDSVYNALCTQNKRSIQKEQYQTTVKETPSNILTLLRTKYYTVTDIQNPYKISKNNTDIMSEPEQDQENDENISFDFVTDSHELTAKSSAHNFENTTVCKDILVVDQLFDLLKEKLSNDQHFRDLLLTRKPLPNTEETFTDSSVAAIMSQIYSSKVSPTTTKSTDNEYVNSTFLADLVEAVIFRSSDKISTSEVTEPQFVMDVKPVKIQAELGEIRSNSDFTGHYFFPEDDNDQTSSDRTDNYYDSTDFPISDVAFEIEDLRRNKGTKDFLEEILESDFATETETQLYKNRDLSIKDNKLNGDVFKVRIESEKTKELIDEVAFQDSRKRREILDITNSNRKNIVREIRQSLDMYVYYKDLLKQLASDLKWLKLQQKYHCSQNHSVQQSITLTTFLIGIMFFLY